MLKLLGGLALTVSFASGVAFAESRASIVYGQEYSCKSDQVRLVVNACQRKYTYQNCAVQYKNRYAPDGNGALVDIHQEDLERSLVGCTVAGHAVASHPEETGRPGQALYLGSWYDVEILGSTPDGVRVRWNSSRSEDVMPPDRVRGAPGDAPPVRVASGSNLRPGHYQCIGRGAGGAVFNMAGFTIMAGNAYAHDQGSRGSVDMGDAGELAFAGGALDGQRALYDASGGAAVIRLYNEAHTRTVVDCGGPAG